MADDLSFSIEGWDEFVNNFANLVDKWEDKKAILLKRMGNISHVSQRISYHTSISFHSMP